jgi:hypothetical protein
MDRFRIVTWGFLANDGGEAEVARSTIHTLRGFRLTLGVELQKQRWHVASSKRPDSSFSLFF